MRELHRQELSKHSRSDLDHQWSFWAVATALRQPLGRIGEWALWDCSNPLPHRRRQFHNSRPARGTHQICKGPGWGPTQGSFENVLSFIYCYHLTHFFNPKHSKSSLVFAKGQQHNLLLILKIGAFTALLPLHFSDVSASLPYSTLCTQPRHSYTGGVKQYIPAFLHLFRS